MLFKKCSVCVFVCVCVCVCVCVYGRRKEDGNVVGPISFYTDYAGSRPTFLRKDFTPYQTTRCQYLPHINLDSHQLSFCVIL